MFSVQYLPAANHAAATSIVDSETALAVWIAIGIVGLVIGAIAVRVSIRRLAQVAITAAEREVSYVMATPQNSPLKVAA